MSRRLRRTLLISLQVIVVTGIGLLIYGWPFLTYPVTELEFDFPAPLEAERIERPYAGVAMRDITPPIGVPKFGYSSFARDADGFHTRLKARAFYIHAPGQTPLALIQADLGTGSLPLHHRVAELVAASTDVPSHALSLLVTHTHSGPGNYLGSDFYNVSGANRPGFDPQLFEFLAQQLADAVIEAYRQRRPAKVAVGQTDVWGLTRNRSLAAWAENFDIPEEQQTEALALQAVNPRMTLLRIDLEQASGCYAPAGALTLFSIHGTAIPAFTSPVHGDVWSWLSRDLENRQRNARDDCSSDTPFVHGAAQATHADNNPNIVNDLRGHREARRVGQALAQQAATLFDSLAPQLEARLETAVASRQLDLLDQVEQAQYGLCERAVPGASLAGAANGDEVFPLSYLPYFAEDWPRSVFTDGCQGVKQWLVSKLQLLLPANRFPHRALVQVVRINELLIVPLPWEVTLESGNRIREAVADTLPAGDWRIEVSSLANGYFGYAVTAEEYRRQYYEGGHTLYGPGTSAFLVEQSARLARDLFATNNRSLNELPASTSFALVSRSYWPTETSTDVERAWLGDASFVAATEDEEAHWLLQYRGVSPADVQLHKPLLAIELLDGDDTRVMIDDQQTDLRLRYLGEEDGAHEYEVRWYNPPVAHDQVRYRLRVEARAGQPALHSPPFG
ncbi:MAG: neutral/alkaline non-lysosomal ceramidase N-terminal domain-containing protein [Alcanivoracaceae bacterium]|nr:neutral/alkaline non-lysosomal ceramidase N-terminal domain-containing protein [Alcanivoracaceae bacterium]